MMQQKETYLTYWTANAFRWRFAYVWRFNSCFVANDEGYPKMQLVISDFEYTVFLSISIYPKEETKFTATAPVSKWEVA